MIIVQKKIALENDKITEKVGIIIIIIIIIVIIIIIIIIITTLFECQRI